METNEKNVQLFRVYTSISAAPLTMTYEELNKNGAFLKTKCLPELNETVTFEAIGENLSKLHVGSAKVSELRDSAQKGMSGFTIKFDEELPENVLAPRQ